MSFTIDRVTYRKTIHPIGTGYDKRPKGLRPETLLIHTTNGKGGSSLEAEARYLRDSESVGAHYLVGKDGEILELLDPELRAWHAGVALPAYINSKSIGVEVHHAIGEAWTPAQHDALTWLAQTQLMPEYDITAGEIETHRAVALPHGRKVDPSDWSDAAFYAWRASLTGQLYVPQRPAGLTTYVTTCAVNVRQGPSRLKPIPLGGHCVLDKNFVFQSDVTVRGQAIGGNDIWIHVLLPAAWGFVHSSCVHALA